MCVSCDFVVNVIDVVFVMNTNRGIWEDEEVFLGLFKGVAKEGGISSGNLLREKQSLRQTLSCLPHLALQLLVLS